MFENHVISDSNKAKDFTLSQRFENHVISDSNKALNAGSKLTRLRTM